MGVKMQLHISTIYDLVQLLQLARRVSVLVHAGEIVPEIYLHIRRHDLAQLLDGFHFQFEFGVVLGVGMRIAAPLVCRRLVDHFSVRTPPRKPRDPS